MPMTMVNDFPNELDITVFEPLPTSQHITAEEAAAQETVALPREPAPAKMPGWILPVGIGVVALALFAR